MVFLFSRVPKGVPAFCYNKAIWIISSRFRIVVPTATLLLKAVKGSQSIRRRIKYNLQTTSPLHSYVIAHSVCDLEHANLTLSLPPQSHNHSSRREEDSSIHNLTEQPHPRAQGTIPWFPAAWVCSSSTGDR